MKRGKREEEEERGKRLNIERILVSGSFVVPNTTSRDLFLPHFEVIDLFFGGFRKVSLIGETPNNRGHTYIGPRSKRRSSLIGQRLEFSCKFMWGGISK